MKTKISFIVASFNEVESIAATLNSIFAVMSKNDELIVVDGASTDGTQDIVTELSQNRQNITLISEPDTGLYHAWNKAIALAKGEWLSFLGCGDLLTIGYRETMTQCADYPKVNFVHCVGRFYELRDGNQHKLQTFGRPLDKPTFRKRMRICHVGALHHSSLFKNNNFSVDFRSVADYHFLLRQLDNLESAFAAQELVHILTGGVSTKAVAPVIEELDMKRTLYGYSLPKYAFLLIEKLLRSLLSRTLRKIYYGFVR